MAPAKRMRAHEAEETIGMLDSASSNLGRDSRKRPRLSHITPGEPESDDGLMEDNVHEHSQSQHGGASGTQPFIDYKKDRDEAASSTSGDELDVAREAERIKRRNAQFTENLPAECGVIESVTCVNFMCHTKLQVNFGPLINFIIGHNGSGKSAVLTALTLCLGGKATSTNRGQSLRAFVKEGQESSTLSVKIKNQGSSAYMSDVFGDSIIVERHFSKSGASGFKIKSANGRIITTKKSALDEICDFYALQLDNPVNVLTQDMARQFLNSFSPNDKYRFFMKGVQLEQLDHDYVLLQESVDNVEWKLQDRKEEIKILAQRCKMAEDKLKQSERHGTLRDRIRVYSRQQAWAQVEEEERQLKVREGHLQLAHEKIAQRQQEAVQFDSAYEHANDNYARLASVLDEEKLTLLPAMEEQKVLKEKWEVHKKEMADTIAEQRQIRESYENAQRRCDTIETQISAERRRLAAADGGSQASRLQEIDDAQTAWLKINRDKDEHLEKQPALDKNVIESREKVDKLQPHLRAKGDELQQAENRLLALTNDRNQQSSAYNVRLPDLLRYIQSEPRFREKPVGPMGYHVRLLKPEWSSVLETTFGGALNSFVVTSKEDQITLAELMRKSQCTYSVYIGKPARLDISANEPDPHFDTILRVVDIDNDLVRNQLIINNAIENTILIRKRTEAVDIMDQQTRLQGVKACITMHDTSKGYGIRLQYGRGGLSMSPIQIWKAPPRMKTDAESQIKMAKEIVQGLKQEVHELELRKRSYVEQHTKAKQAVVKHKTEFKQLLHESQVAEDNIQRLKDELEQDTPQDGRLDVLKDSLKESEEERDQLEAQNQDANDAREKVSSKGADIKKERDAVLKRVEELHTKINKAQNKLEKQADRRQSTLREKNAAYEMIQDAERDRADAQQRVEEYKEHVADFVRQATLICQRISVDPGENYKSLEKKLDRMQQDLRKYQQELGGNPEQLELEALQARMEFNGARQTIANLDALSSDLKRSLEDRHHRWKMFRSRITQRTRSAFTTYLAERAFRGRMEVHHRARTLDLHVEPDITRGANSKGRNTKTLSGGEKSFSTICMLLALWDAMGSPIRCLDEFDVFMDNVNRDVSMKMMIGAARRAVGRQFILITPQAMGNVDVGRDVKIIKLSDPERGQTALNL